MHTGPMPESAGVFQNGYKPTKAEDPDFKCRCGSNDVWYKIWDSSCGGYEDIKYHCKTCDKTWWVESSDS